MSASRLFGAIIRHPRIVLAVALLLAVLSIIYTSQKLEFLTGRDDLMPRHAAFQQDYQAYRAAFGDQEEIAVVIEGADPALVSRFSDTLYARLTQEKRLFLEVLYPGGMPYFRQNGLLFSSLDELKAMRSTLELAGPVLQDLAAAPSIQTLFSSLTNQIDDYLKAPTPDKLQRLTFMLGTLDKGFAGFDGKKSALSMDSFLSGSSADKPSALENAGRQQVLAIRPLKETDSFVPAEKAIKKVREELNILRQKPEFKGISAGITGVPVLEYEEMATSMNDMTIASILSLVLTVILLLVAFRGVKNTIAAMVALLIAISIAFGLATLFVGHLNILSMAFAVMLLGLGVEYGIQVVLRHQELLQQDNYATALQESLSSNLRPVLLAFSTTALAFLTFLLTDFRGIAELGLIAAMGVFVCFAATFTVLPAMLVMLHKESDSAALKPVPHNRKPALQRLFARPGLIVAATALLALAGTAALTRVPFDFNMLNLQAKGLESVTYAYKLMKSKENSGYFGVSMARDRDEALRLTKRFEALPSVDHVVSLPALVPDQQPEKLAELERIRQIMAKVQPVPYEENLRVMELPAIFEGFRERVEKLKLNLEGRKLPEAQPIAAFLKTLDTFFAGLEKEKDGNALTMLREMQEAMFAPLPEKLKLLKESLQARAVTEADVPQALKQRFVGKDGRLLLQIAPKKEIFNEQPLAEFVTQIKSVDPHATGEPVSVYESFKILKLSYLQAFLYALGGVVLILLIAFRSLRSTLLGVAPLAVGLLLMVGGMWLFGLKFNVANIIVMPLLLGVGIDSAIYIISRHLKGEESPVEVATSSAGKGVFLNALTILFSFGALMVARHQGVFSIGAVMSLGMTAIVLAFLIFLPALLLVSVKRYRN
ncbi:MMPL family transporter [Trichlorobacter lovleyi]|uniref:MMPL family transporter n=1 Tax=Trichlorobacter lovleyi TaxID=313985 RepID=UPI00223FC544|nr:MMPL family transporter [Trichlorobacter lovleyi]QOX79551.1 MMPL family transporter [Trichlorobacter lovleyi]